MKSVSKLTKGFTIVELLVVIVVIGILATIVTIGLSRYQSQARDTQREADTNILAEGLEKYYDQNGEYPSCAAMTNGAVTTNLDIDQETVKAPKSTAANSIVCDSLSTGNTSDSYAYVGDGSQTCATGSSCLGWTIQYKSEETGEIKTITSRRTARLATSGEVSLTATVVSNTQINLSWNSVGNVSSYQLIRSTSSSYANPTTINTSSTAYSATGLAPGQRYYFKLTPYAGVQAGTPSEATAVTTISPPTGTLTTSASLVSGVTARGVAGGVSCPAGSTLQYSIGYSERNTNSGITISYGGFDTGVTRDVGAQQGWNYTFQSRARCAGASTNSTEVSSAQNNVTRGIDTPGSPWYTGDTSWAAGYRYNVTWGTSCPYGTWQPEGTQVWYKGLSGGDGPTRSATFFDWWYLGWNSGQVEGWPSYYAYYRCTTDFTTSGWSATTGVGIYVYCDGGRRNWSANPRCDGYGQDPNYLPWGP